MTPCVRAGLYHHPVGRHMRPLPTCGSTDGLARPPRPCLCPCPCPCPCPHPRRCTPGFRQKPASRARRKARVSPDAGGALARVLEGGCAARHGALHRRRHSARNASDAVVILRRGCAVRGKLLPTRALPCFSIPFVFLGVRIIHNYNGNARHGASIRTDEPCCVVSLATRTGNVTRYSETDAWLPYLEVYFVPCLPE